MRAPSSFRRYLTYSLLVHIVLLVVLLFAGPRTSRRVSLPQAIGVRIVTAPPAKKPAKRAPKPKPIPKPKPKPEVKAPTDKVVLPEKPTKPKPKPPKPEPEQVDYEDLMAELRAERGEERPQVQQEAPPIPGVPDAGAAGTPEADAAGTRGEGGLELTPEEAAWLRAAKLHMYRVWVLPTDFRRTTLQAIVEVDLDASGNLDGEIRIVRSSGNPYYDESVLRAMRKANPLPAPPEPGAWSFVFQPEEI